MQLQRDALFDNFGSNEISSPESKVKDWLLKSHLEETVDEGKAYEAGI